jgi:hypothetical protein
MLTSTEQARVFIGPGLSPFKRIMTMVGVLGVTLLVLWIAIHHGFSAVGSTIAALIFITGFILYLRIVAPVPFMISLSEEGVSKKSRNGELIELGWNEITKIKEEFFRNGKRISVAVYRKPGATQQKARAWVVYRDDVKDIDGLAEAIREMKPETCEWTSETVHD